MDYERTTMNKITNAENIVSVEFVNSSENGRPQVFIEYVTGYKAIYTHFDDGWWTEGQNYSNEPLE